MPAPIVGRTMMAAANLLPVLLFYPSETRRSGSWGHAAASDSQPQDKYVNDYFRTLVWSPPVLGGRLQGKSSVYTSKDLEKIGLLRRGHDIPLMKPCVSRSRARQGTRGVHVAQAAMERLDRAGRVQVSGHGSLDDEKLEDAYKDAFRKSLKPYDWHAPLQAA
eukprot:767950-Hanusia_phi.AAC.3